MTIYNIRIRHRSISIAVRDLFSEDYEETLFMHHRRLDADSIKLNGRLTVDNKELRNTLKNMRPDQIITSDNPDVDLDEDSMLPSAGGEDDYPLGNDVESVLSELEKLMVGMPGSDGMKVAAPRAATKTKTRIFYVLSNSKTKKRFVFEADLRQSTFTYGRMTFRLLLSNTKAIKLISFFHTGEKLNGNISILAEKIVISCISPDKETGKAKVMSKTPMLLVRSKNVSQCKLIGLEVRQSKAVKADKAIVIMNFSTNG